MLDYGDGLIHQWITNVLSWSLRLSGAGLCVTCDWSWYLSKSAWWNSIKTNHLQGSKHSLQISVYNNLTPSLHPSCVDRCTLGFELPTFNLNASHSFRKSQPGVSSSTLKTGLNQYLILSNVTAVFGRKILMILYYPSCTHHWYVHLLLVGMSWNLH